MTREVSVLCCVLIWLTLPVEAAEPYSAINKAPPPAPSKTVEGAPAFNIAIDGSVPVEIESNPNRMSGNATADFHGSPFLKLSALTNLRPDLTYSIYGDMSVDRYAQFYNNTSSSAGLGTQLVKKWDGLQLGVVYDWNQYYDREFRSFLGANNDIGGFVRYSYLTPDANLRIKPSFSVTSRLDDQLVVQRYLYHLKVDFERKLVDRWSFIVTPRLRFYDYIGSQSGRHDWVYAASAGFRHAITDGMNFTTTVSYENRRSNLPAKSYDNWTAQASLDFSYMIYRAKGGAESDFLHWYSR